jgi:hypothetical protein
MLHTLGWVEWSGAELRGAQQLCLMKYIALLWVFDAARKISRDRRLSA